jgi:hypothetical protein
VASRSYAQPSLHRVVQTPYRDTRHTSMIALQSMMSPPVSAENRQDDKKISDMEANLIGSGHR